MQKNSSNNSTVNVTSPIKVPHLIFPIQTLSSVSFLKTYQNICLGNFFSLKSKAQQHALCDKVVKATIKTFHLRIWKFNCLCMKCQATPHPPKDLQTANGNSESIFHLPAKLIWGRTRESNCINLQRLLASWQPFVMSTVFSLQLATNASIVWPIKTQMAQHTHTHAHRDV